MGISSVYNLFVKGHMEFWRLFYSFKLVKDRYSFIAPFYTSLARLVFGTSLKELKVAFVEDLVQKRVLIIGGGDALDYQDFAEEISGEYWELSAAMLHKAKQNLSKSKLEFYLGNFQVVSENQFDEVWLHFVLDTFTDSQLESFLQEIKSLLKPSSKIYLVDFFPPQTRLQKMIQAIMLGFFRVFMAHSRKDLPNYEEILGRKGFRKSEELSKRKGWIRAQLWEIPS